MNRYDMARFFSKVRVTPSGCWEWTGAIGRRYGTFKYAGALRLAHRVSYEAFVGPIADGLEIDHLCFYPKCVCPAHLEAVTHLENVRRALARRTHCTRGLHPLTPENRLHKVTRTRRYSTCKPCNEAWWDNFERQGGRAAWDRRKAERQGLSA